MSKAPEERGFFCSRKYLLERLRKEITPDLSEQVGSAAIPPALKGLMEVWSPDRLQSAGVSEIDKTLNAFIIRARPEIKSDDNPLNALEEKGNIREYLRSHESEKATMATVMVNFIQLAIQASSPQIPQQTRSETLVGFLSAISEYDACLPGFSSYLDAALKALSPKGNPREQAITQAATGLRQKWSQEQIAQGLIYGGNEPHVAPGLLYILGIDKETIHKRDEFAIFTVEKVSSEACWQMYRNYPALVAQEANKILGTPESLKKFLSENKLPPRDNSNFDKQKAKFAREFKRRFHIELLDEHIQQGEYGKMQWNVRQLVALLPAPISIPTPEGPESLFTPDSASQIANLVLSEDPSQIEAGLTALKFLSDKTRNGHSFYQFSACIDEIEQRGGLQHLLDWKLEPEDLLPTILERAGRHQPLGLWGMLGYEERKDPSKHYIARIETQRGIFPLEHNPPFYIIQQQYKYYPNELAEKLLRSLPSGYTLAQQYYYHSNCRKILDFIPPSKEADEVRYNMTFEALRSGDIDFVQEMLRGDSGQKTVAYALQRYENQEKSGMYLLCQQDARKLLTLAYGNTEKATPPIDLQDPPLAQMFFNTLVELAYQAQEDERSYNNLRTLLNDKQIAGIVSQPPFTAIQKEYEKTVLNFALEADVLGLAKKFIGDNSESLRDEYVINAINRNKDNSARLIENLKWYAQHSNKSLSLKNNKKIYDAFLQVVEEHYHQGHLETIRDLLSDGTVIEALLDSVYLDTAYENNQAHPPILEIVLDAGCTELAKRLIQKRKASKNINKNTGIHAEGITRDFLFKAIKSEDLKAIAFAQECGIDLNNPFAGHAGELLENNPLVYALQHNKMKAFDQMVKDGANLTLALAAAARKNNPEAVQTLLAKGAIPNRKDGANISTNPLQEAILQGNLSVMEALITAGANLALCNIGESTLRAHIEEGHFIGYHMDENDQVIMVPESPTLEQVNNYLRLFRKHCNIEAISSDHSIVRARRNNSQDLKVLYDAITTDEVSSRWTDSRGRTAAHTYISKNTGNSFDPDTLRKLIDNDKRILQAKDYKGRDLLTLAIERGNHAAAICVIQIMDVELETIRKQHRENDQKASDLWRDGRQEDDNVNKLRDEARNKIQELEANDQLRSESYKKTEFRSDSENKELNILIQASRDPGGTASEQLYQKYAELEEVSRQRKPEEMKKIIYEAVSGGSVPKRWHDVEGRTAAHNYVSKMHGDDFNIRDFAQLIDKEVLQIKDSQGRDLLALALERDNIEAAVYLIKKVQDYTLFTEVGYRREVTKTTIGAGDFNKKLSACTKAANDKEYIKFANAAEASEEIKEENKAEGIGGRAAFEKHKSYMNATHKSWFGNDAKLDELNNLFNNVQEGLVSKLWVDDKGRTPAHLYVLKSGKGFNIEVMDDLLDSNIQKREKNLLLGGTQRDHKGRTILEAALNAGNFGAAIFLVKKLGARFQKEACIERMSETFGEDLTKEIEVIERAAKDKEQDKTPWELYEKHLRIEEICHESLPYIGEGYEDQRRIKLEELFKEVKAGYLAADYTDIKGRTPAYHYIKHFNGENFDPGLFEQLMGKDNQAFAIRYKEQNLLSFAIEQDNLAAALVIIQRIDKAKCIEKELEKKKEEIESAEAYREQHPEYIKELEEERGALQQQLEAAQATPEFIPAEYEREGDSRADKAFNKRLHVVYEASRDKEPNKTPMELIAKHERLQKDIKNPEVQDELFAGARQKNIPKDWKDTKARSPAQLYIKNKGGESFKEEDFLQLLGSDDAVINLKDNKGRDLLEYALEYKHEAAALCIIGRLKEVDQKREELIQEKEAELGQLSERLNHTNSQYSHFGDDPLLYMDPIEDDVPPEELAQLRLAIAASLEAPPNSPANDDERKAEEMEERISPERRIELLNQELIELRDQPKFDPKNYRKDGWGNLRFNDRLDSYIRKAEGERLHHRGRR